MRAFFALLRREYAEHRVAFFYAPMALVLVFAVFVATTILAHRVQVVLRGVPGASSRVYEAGYFGIAGLWWLYACMMLFFYFADAFHADTRNNAMLFWKSMPVTDFKILASKLVAGATQFPGLVFFAALLSGLVLVVGVLALPIALPGMRVPDAAQLVSAWLQLSAVFLGYLVIALLWYLPFFAWVGALSTIFGRWSIPLALLIPVLLSLFEGVADFAAAPGGSYVLDFLRQRSDFRYDTAPLAELLSSAAPLDASRTLRELVAGADWTQTVFGIVFAVFVVWLASLYRRRVIKG